jgi:hypothetical protein
LATRGTLQRIVWLCLGVLAVDTAAGILVGPARAAGVVILVILAGCFLLTLGHGARDVPSQADHPDDGGAGDRSHS